MNCIVCGEIADIIRVFKNGALRVCPRHNAEIGTADSQNYSPRRFRKYLPHPLNPKRFI